MPQRGRGNHARRSASDCLPPGGCNHARAAGGGRKAEQTADALPVDGDTKAMLPGRLGQGRGVEPRLVARALEGLAAYPDHARRVSGRRQQQHSYSAGAQ